MNRHVKWIIGVVGGVILGSALGLGAWNLDKTASIPEVYETKVEVNRKIGEVKTQVSDKLDFIIDEMKEQRHEIREINRHLRDE
jgi:tryptophanyl-tRNA synthetase